MADQPCDLSVDFAGLSLRTPLVAASGTFGWGTEFDRLQGFPAAALGAIVLKSTTREPRRGNPTPRIVETAGGAGLVNSIGLENPGVQAVVRHYLPRLVGLDLVVIANVAGSTVEEYPAVAEPLAAHEGVRAIEVNISCPNVRKGGMAFGTEPAAAAAVVAAVCGVTDKPVVAKLTPNVADVAAIAQACAEAGANALSLVNTLPALPVDVRTRRPILGSNTGGLSGPAIKPVALLKVHEAYRVARSCGLPILGGGGILSGTDALEFVLAGASAVSVGTRLLRDPLACGRVVGELRALLAEQGESRLADLVGVLILHE